jgi:hypothetical protein
LIGQSKFASPPPWSATQQTVGTTRIMGHLFTLRGTSPYALNDAEPLQAPALNHPNQDHHQGDDQKDMNESTQGERGNKSQKPENNQDYRNRYEHVAPPLAAAWKAVSISCRSLLVSGNRRLLYCE